MTNHNVDSLKLYKSHIDSLNKIIAVMHNNKSAFKIGEASVQAALIVAATTLFTVIVGFIFKDYLIPGWIEKRTASRTGQALFQLYKVNLFRSANAINNRLHEIYRTRSHYLWSNAPLNTFYDYKYKSSIYRLCVLMGWIRAYRILESSMTIAKSDAKFHEISGCISALESALADGQRIEMYVAKALFTIAKVKSDTVPSDTLEKFSVEVDHLVNQYLQDDVLDYIADLSPAQQDAFIVDIEKLLATLKIKHEPLAANKELIMKEVSVRLGLIYRDWQQGIGDLMLQKDEQTYNAISYKTFEEYWGMKEDTSEKKWLKRAEVMFENLDLRVDQQSDSRIEQLKLVYASIYSLLNALYTTETGVSPISQEDFNKIPATIDSPRKP
ncbi:hypothetical protein [Mucilaginibacter flavidus]|uniref:hypothetical protein n=1 Tax=Mucilaginibacter flavidus TaxID=2949309 RepID=UPI002093D2E8|nr:hypothetical protein [Mucilaginibacter flavidus]MCO5948667.1 hypothetical protein [Mucilaginibacter flavidus]